MTYLLFFTLTQMTYENQIGSQEVRRRRKVRGFLVCGRAEGEGILGLWSFIYMVVDDKDTR
jgi:hypothetical protein